MISALIAIKSNVVDPINHLNNWNKGDPCTSKWRGVLCFDSVMADGYLHVQELLTLYNDVDISSSESFLRAGELPTLIVQSTGHALHVFINGQLSVDAMVSTGLAALGYEYINLDDCWAELNRDSKGNLVPNATIFPSETLTCDKRMPGSLGYEEHDANTFASWAYFNAPDGDEPLALDMGSIGKGQVWING
ncbi:unnamed protein product [Camellia sinensis]